MRETLDFCHVNFFGGSKLISSLFLKKQGSSLFPPPSLGGGGGRRVLFARIFTDDIIFLKSTYWTSNSFWKLRDINFCNLWQKNSFSGTIYQKCFWQFRVNIQSILFQVYIQIITIYVYGKIFIHMNYLQYYLWLNVFNCKKNILLQNLF